MTDIFQRTEKLIGTERLNILKNATVAVVGLGGVGSYTVEALGRVGVGHLILVDPDQVEVTNINRQLPALTSSIGKYKADVLANRLLDINPNIKVTKHNLSLNAANQAKLLDGQIDYVVDAIDSVPDKVGLIKYCFDQQMPIISAMGAANRIDPTLFKIADIKNTSVCPLAKKVRKELRNLGIYEGVEVLYSMEKPINIDMNKDNILGTISFVTGIAGLLLASVVIRSLVNF